MIAELGHFALVLALIAALAQALLPGWGAWRGDRALQAVAGPAALAQLAALTVAFAALGLAFWRSDFSLALVAEHSHAAKPWIYKLTGIWGNHPGSMLLWILILALFGAAIALFDRRLDPGFKARLLAVQGALGAGVLTFSLATSNPFARLESPPLAGQGLNPVLQHPGLALHPPLLYVGYVGFSVAFAFAVAGLTDRAERPWARWMRGWTLLAWTGLTAGLALGSWWAYYELGWGGFWFWDPVENAALMPWLTGTALIHSTLVTARAGALKHWTLLLALATFSLSLLGTFLVRSGLLQSVHSFASAPGRGLFILALIALFTGGALALYAWRAPRLTPGPALKPISREGALVVNNLLLITAAATVLVGTLYPLALSLLADTEISVGPPYFTLTVLPVGLVLTALMGLGPWLPWGRGPRARRLRPLLAAAVLALLVALLAWSWRGERGMMAAVAAGLGVWLIVATAAELARRLGVGRPGLPARAWRLPAASWGMALAHLGLGVAMLGMAGTAGWGAARQGALAPGESLTMGDLTLTLRAAEKVQGPNYSAARLDLSLRRGPDFLGWLRPERRHYPAAGIFTTEADSLLTVTGSDIYAAIGPQGADGEWPVRLQTHPLIAWLWAGAATMGLGGTLAAYGAGLGALRRRRDPALAAPAVPAAPSAAEAAPEDAAPAGRQAAARAGIGPGAPAAPGVGS